jgi:hypothetical protein
MGGSTQGLYIKKTTVILYLSTLVFYFKKLWSLCNNYVSPHFGGETYCFFPVRLSVTQFVSATPPKLLNRISWSLVGSKDTIFSCAYYQEIFDLLNFVGVMPFELRNFPKFTTEAACQCASEVYFGKFLSSKGHNSHKI